MENNLKRIIIALLLVVVGVLVYTAFKPKAEAPLTENPTIQIPEPVVTGNAGDLVSFSVLPGGTISGVQTVTGTVQGGYFFEANILVNILGANMAVLKSGYGTATTDWMTAGPVTFTSSIDATGLPTGPGYIELRNDNPSGDPIYDKSIFIPIVIQ